MSRFFRISTGTDISAITTGAMREWCQRPGKMNEDGSILYKTEQHHKKECDVNLIIKKYDKQGIITHINRIEAEFGDLKGVDFKEAMDLITRSQGMFDQLPSEIRKRFQNTPEKLIEFMENSDNRAEAIKLGLIRADWSEETDGLGEHVQKDEDRKKKVKEPKDNEE